MKDSKAAMMSGENCEYNMHEETDVPHITENAMILRNLTSMRKAMVAVSETHKEMLKALVEVVRALTKLGKIMEEHTREIKRRK